jgi:multidrug efflux pump subunit AcrA (membrane-fusion protein)
MTNRQLFADEAWLPSPAAVSLLLACLALGSCQRAAGAAPERRPLPVAWTLAEPATSLTALRRYHGELRFRRSSELAFRRSDRVVELCVQEGQAVAAGDLLARLETRPLAAEQRAAAARVRSAAARLEELERGPRPEQIELAAARVREWEARLAAAQLTAQRLQVLAEGKHGSQEEADLARRAAEAGAAALEGARASLSELENGTRSEQIEAARAELAAAEAEEARLGLELELSELRAPFAGRVAELGLEVGALAAPGQSALRLVESDALEAWIGLPPAVLVELEARLADSPQVLLDLEGRQVAATWIAALPESDPATRTRTALFALTSADSARSSAGALVCLPFERTVEARGLWLPAEALVRGEEGLWAAYALVERGGRTELERRVLEVVHDAGPRVLVSGLLAEGERVLASGVHRAVAGQWVEAADAEPSGEAGR